MCNTARKRDMLFGRRWALHRLAALLAVTLLMAWLAPQDIVLGDISRLAYLHGAMVWVALVCFSAGGLLGLAHLIANRGALHWQSQLLVRAGLLFWIAYLPLSAWTARLAWSQAFLAEPRYAMAVTVAVVGVSFQVGAVLLESNRLGSLLNTSLALIVWTMLARTPRVMHPRAPVRASESGNIKLLFLGLIITGLVIAVQAGVLMTPLARKATN